MSLEILTHCPICAGKVFEDYMEVEDHSVSHGTFKISRCRKCNFLFTNPRPAEENIGTYYDSENYISHHADDPSLLSKVYNSVRKIAVKGKLNLIRKFDTHSERTLLDIGCGTGFFLKACREMNWEIAGTEPDDDARIIARQATGATIQNSVFHPDFNSRQFSSITLWHVLEHVHKLEETMNWIHQHLKPNGVVLIAVPNPEAYDAVLFDKHWAAYDVPRHLYHFSRQTMTRLLQKHQFNLVDMKCMLFDSYYVSLLSNQYKHGKSRLFNSILTGTISNIKGLSLDYRHVNSSSIIYIARKK